MTCATAHRTDRTTNDSRRDSDRDGKRGCTRCGGCKNTGDRDTTHRGPLVALDAEDRRKHPRRNARMGAHLFGQSTPRFIAATTLDLSAGGALLSLTHHSELHPGETVALGLDHQGPAITEKLITARVVRRYTFDTDTRVALEFDQPQPALAALSNAA